MRDDAKEIASFGYESGTIVTVLFDTGTFSHSGAKNKTLLEHYNIMHFICEFVRVT